MISQLSAECAVWLNRGPTLLFYTLPNHCCEMAQGQFVFYPSLATQGQVGGQADGPACAGGGLGLNQVAEPSGDFGFQQDYFAGTGGAEDFYISQRGQFQPGERGN